jgi:virginiamycin B lyase
VRKPLVLLAAILSFAPAQFAKVRAVRSPGSASSWVVQWVPVSYMDGLAAASDGSLWFGGADLGVVRPSGTVELLKKGPCGPPVVPLDGTVWCRTVLPGDIVESIRRVDRNGTATDFPVRAIAGIRTLVRGGDGNLLFTESAKDRLGRIDASGAVEEIDLPPSLESPGPMAAGVDGAIWFAARRAVARIISDRVYEVHASESLFAGRSRFTGFTSIAATEDGAIWLGLPTEARTSGFAKGGAIVRLTATGTFSEVLALPFFHSPRWLTAAPDGSIWFAERNDYFAPIEELVRIRPDGQVDRYGLPGVDFSYPSVAGIFIEDSGRVTIAVNYVTGGAAIARFELP